MGVIPKHKFPKMYTQCFFISDVGVNILKSTLKNNLKLNSNTFEKKNVLNPLNITEHWNNSTTEIENTFWFSKSTNYLQNMYAVYN